MDPKNTEGDFAVISFRNLCLGFLEAYGWLLLVGAMVAVFLYHQIIKPKFRVFVEERELINRKKRDVDLDAVHEAKLRAAREKLQQKYQIDAIREKERLEEKKLQALKKAAAELGVENLEPMKTVLPVSVKQFVIDLISSTPVVIFSKSLCPYSRKAKQALSTYRLPESLYKTIELDTMENCSEIQDYLEELTGSRTVPRVFIGGSFFGGGDKTVTAHRDGSLNLLLSEAGLFHTKI